MYIPDPVELMERAMDEQCALVDSDNKYSCVKCGRKFNTEEMIPISDHPASALECGKPECKEKCGRN